MIKPFSNGNNTTPVGYPPRPPLTRIDSRGSFPIRPGFPNPPNLQGSTIRPPGQQIRPPLPGTGFAQRPPGLPSRPPFQPPFPNNQANPNIQSQLQAQVRPGGPSVRPVGSLPPRGIVPAPRPPGLVHQRSDPYSEQQKTGRENFTRSQTLDSPEVIDSTSKRINVEDNDASTINMAKNEPSRSVSNSLHSSNSHLNEELQRTTKNYEEPNRTLSRNNSIEEKRVISNSQESLDRRSDQEYPSRPESRSGSRMNQILENDNTPKHSSRQPSGNDVLSQRPESRNSMTSKPPLPPSANSVRDYNRENQNQNSETSTPVIKPEKKDSEDLDKGSLQLKNLKKPKSPIRIEGDNDSGVDESTQGNDQSSNGDTTSPRKSASKPPKRVSSATPSKSRSLSRDSKSPSLKSPDSTATTPGTVERKKLPMNKIQVGSAPSPNLKEVRSKIGSLQNTTHKPGGGNVKIENKKIELKNVTPRIEAKNDKYISKGGEKKIISQKLQWNAKSKIGSLENASHKPVSSGKKIETVKLDFKEKAKPKVGSKDNIKYNPGGSDVKIEHKKIEFQVQSKVGSLDNVKHKPKGGDKKIFDDKDYLRQMSAISSENHSLSGSQNSLPSQPDPARGADENLNQHRQS